MDIDELNAYRKDLLEECTDEAGFITESSVLEYILPMINESKLIDSEDYADCYYMYAADNIKINGYSFNETGERLQLFIVNEDSISINEDNDSLNISKKTYYENYFSRVTRFINYSLNRNLFSDIQDAHPVKSLISFLSSEKGISKIDVIEVFLISATITVETRSSILEPKRLEFKDEVIDYICKKSDNSERKTFLIKKKLIDLNFIESILASQGGREPLLIDFKSSFGDPLRCILAASEEDYDCYLTVVPAKMLQELYRSHSTRLLEKNVRSFLQFKGANQKMKKTLIDEPQHFLAYNNGLTITAAEAVIEESNGVASIVALKDFQIVNGGQTTAGIYFALKEIKYDIEKVKVPAKINILKSKDEEAKDELITNISIFSNSQSKVSNVDLSSRNGYLIKIKALSNTIVTPLGTKWFFERARGEINTLIRKYKNRKAFLEKEYPKKRRITKEQLAKYYVSWGEQPYLVKKGGEKVFGIFLRILEKEYPIPNDLDLTFFEDMIAKAILFKELEALYASGKKAIGQIRSAVVPYTISLLYKHMKDVDTQLSSFKLLELWKNGNIDSDLAAILKELMRLVNKILVEEKITDDVNESTKKKEQWDKIKDHQEIKKFFKDPAAKSVLTKHKFTSEQFTKRYPILDSFLAETTCMEPSIWFALAKWAKENRKFGSNERKFLFYAGVAANSQNGMSVKQAKWALDLYNQAKEDGFDN